MVSQLGIFAASLRQFRRLTFYRGFSAGSEPAKRAARTAQTLMFLNTASEFGSVSFYPKEQNFRGSC